MAEPQTPANPEQVDLSTIPISPEGANGNNGTKKPAGEEDLVTVFHDKDNFNVKHPLMHKWTLWFTKPPSGKVSSAPNVSATHPHTLTFCRETTGTIY